jgi:VanZ family protein
MAKTILYFWKPILWLILTCYALFIPATKLPVEPFLRIPHFDKIVHFGLFFTLCLFLVRPFKKLTRNGYFMAALTSIGLSGMLEFIQHLLSSTRQSDIFDFLANTTGVLSALLFFKLFVEKRKWEMLF